jgi:predicted transposase YdaD
MALDLKIEDTFTFKQGKLEGEKIGEKIGEKPGEKLGEKKNRDKMILSLYRKGKFNIEDIADAAEVSVEYVKEFVKQTS